MARLGLAGTRVPPDAGPFGIWRHVLGPAIATTTPGDMAQLLRLLERGELLERSGQSELRRLLQIPEALDPLASGLPPGATVLAKVGNLEQASNVAGLVETSAGALGWICLPRSGASRRRVLGPWRSGRRGSSRPF